MQFVLHVAQYLTLGFIYGSIKKKMVPDHYNHQILLGQSDR